jgi:hypothetical protein
LAQFFSVYVFILDHFQLLYLFILIFKLDFVKSLKILCILCGG